MRLLTLAATLAASVVALLGAPAYADAESTGTVEAVETAVESPAAADDAAADAAAAEGAPAVEAPAPVPEATPEPATTAPTQIETASSDPLPAELQEPVARVTSQASAAVETVAREVEQETVGVTTQAVKSTTTSTPLAKVGETGSQVLSSANRSLRSTGDALRSTGDLLRGAGRNLLEAGTTALGVGGSTLHDSTGSSPGPLRSLPDEVTPYEGVGALSGSPLLFVAGPGGIGPDVRLSVANGGAPSVVHGDPLPTLSLSTDLLSSGGGGAWEDRPAPLDGSGPSQPPQTSPTAASGLGGSTFVPIVALLALLALAAPAITRRLRELADLSPPLPFACVLERPG
jgi:hypothetical protein